MLGCQHSPWGAPEHGVLGRHRASPEPRGPPGVGGAAEVVGNDGGEGAESPSGRGTGRSDGCLQGGCLFSHPELKERDVSGKIPHSNTVHCKSSMAGLPKRLKRG